MIEKILDLPLLSGLLHRKLEPQNEAGADDKSLTRLLKKTGLLDCWNFVDF